MKATLEFELPAERLDHLIAVKAPDLLVVLADYVAWLRNQRKHADLVGGAYSFSNASWEKIHRLIEDYDVGDILQ